MILGKEGILPRTQAAPRLCCSPCIHHRSAPTLQTPSLIPHGPQQPVAVSFPLPLPNQCEAESSGKDFHLNASRLITLGKRLGIGQT